MNIALVTGSLSRQGGGITEIVRAIALELGSLETNVSVFGVYDEALPVDRALWNGVQLNVSHARGPKSLSYAPELTSRLVSYQPKLIHQHGIWFYPSYSCFNAARRANAPHLITPQGMLDGWAMRHHSIRKKAAWYLFEKNNLLNCTCINANSLQEAEMIRNMGITTPICVIPNGVSFPAVARLPAPPWAGKWGSEHRILLYLGRLHSKKGLVNLIRAWHQWLSLDGDDGWRLAICGWSQDGHENELHKLISTLRLVDTVALFGPVFESKKAAALDRASAFILPSFSEGLPMSVLEAWSYGLPVVMTPHCNLPAGFSRGAAICIDPTAESILLGLRALGRQSEAERRAMGLNGRNLVESVYAWPSVVRELMQVYRWCLEQGPRPSTMYD